VKRTATRSRLGSSTQGAHNRVNAGQRCLHFNSWPITDCTVGQLCFSWLPTLMAPTMLGLVNTSHQPEMVIGGTAPHSLLWVGSLSASLRSSLLTPHSSRIPKSLAAGTRMNGWIGRGWGHWWSEFLRPRKTPKLHRTSNRPNIVSCTSALEIDYATAPLGTFVRRNLPSPEFEAAHRVANLGLFGTQTH
jgi:hypothetical protein